MIWQRVNVLEPERFIRIENRTRGLLCRFSRTFQFFAFALITRLAFISMLLAAQQQGSAKLSDRAPIRGSVLDAAGKPVPDATVRLERYGDPVVQETRTDAAGAFSFAAIQSGKFHLVAEKAGQHSQWIEIDAGLGADTRHISLLLGATTKSDQEPSHPSSAVSPAMEFSDQPNFTVAGVTDWTAVGGHGSDSTLRTSEALARDTLTLKTRSAEASITPSNHTSNETESVLRASLVKAPGSSEASRKLGEFYLHAERYRDAIPLLENAHQIDPDNGLIIYSLALACEGDGKFAHAQQLIQALPARKQTAELHVLAGDLDEKLGDPLAAVREFEQAVHLEPTEENYFKWGSDLLLHRAVWQAQEVLQKAVDAYPQSARMLTALGAAEFAGARYEDAALRLCEASDMNPSDIEPYIFMGKIETAAPNSLGCIEERLARFAQQRPDNSEANYLYAMAILKRQQQSLNEEAAVQAEGLLNKAVSIDPKCSDAYLELGILSASNHNFEKAISFYNKAVEANPLLGEAHYRLGVAYDRVGEATKAREEFKRHDEIKKMDADAIERQRREVKQFLFAEPGQGSTPPAK